MKDPRHIGMSIFGEESGLRPGTKLMRWKLNMVFKSGGMGDFVNYAAATLWLAKNARWIQGFLFAPKYIVPLLKDIHHGFSSWHVLPSEDFMKYFEDGDSIIAPDVFVDGKNVSPQYLTCTGAHPIEVGFAYYAGLSPAPADGLLPVLDYKLSSLPRAIRKELEHARYVVIPTGNVHEVRATSGRHINPIISHVKKRGLLPVFLGKKDLLGDGIETTKFPDDVNYSEGLDLRDQTTVKEAAAILQHAICTAGLDCGLLHLAALMKDSRLIFGYNITTVAHRKPRRNHGRDIAIDIMESELKCIGCQSKLRQITVHQFDKCLYGDKKCVDLLFKNDSERWTRAIDEILG